jgi:hypothetical protein
MRQGQTPKRRTVKESGLRVVSESSRESAEETGDTTVASVDPATARPLLAAAAAENFGGLELSTMLSEALRDDVDVTLIDKNESFVFGFSKLDVMFGCTTLDAVSLPYRKIDEARGSLPPADDHRDRPRRAERDDRQRRHEADVLVIALGADYDFDATPELAAAGNDFYSVAGAEHLGGLRFKRTAPLLRCLFCKPTNWSEPARIRACGCRRACSLLRSSSFPTSSGS